MLFFVESTLYLSIYFNKALSITFPGSQIIPTQSCELVHMCKMCALCFADVIQCALSVLCVHKCFPKSCDIEFPKTHMNNNIHVSEVIPCKIQFILHKPHVKSGLSILWQWLLCDVHSFQVFNPTVHWSVHSLYWSNTRDPKPGREMTSQCETSLV